MSEPRGYMSPIVERRIMRQRASGGGITNDKTNPRLKNEDDIAAETATANNAARWNSAIKAGHNPKDYGYDEAGQKTAAYTGSKLVPKTPPMTRPNEGVTAPDPLSAARKSIQLTSAKPFDADRNRVPDSIQKPVAPTTGQIDGKDSYEVIRDKREKLIAAGRGEEVFGPSRLEKAYFANKEAGSKPVPMAAASKPAAPVAKPNAVATPDKTYPETSPSGNPATSPGPPKDKSIPRSTAGAETAKEFGLLLKPVVNAGVSAGVLGRQAVKHGRGLYQKGMAAVDTAKGMNRALLHAYDRADRLTKSVGFFMGEALPKATADLSAATSAASAAQTEAAAAKALSKGALDTTGRYDAARKAYELEQRALAARAIVEDTSRLGLEVADDAKYANQASLGLYDDAVAATKNANKLGAAANRFNNVVRPLTKIPGAQWLMKGVKVVAPAMDIYDSGKAILSGQRAEDMESIKNRSAEMSDEWDDGGNVMKKIAGAIYRATPAILGGGGETFTELTAGAKTVGGANLKAQEAEGDLAFYQMRQSLQSKRKDDPMVMRRSMASDEDFAAMPLEQRKEVQHKAWLAAKALRESRKNSR